MPSELAIEPNRLFLFQGQRLRFAGTARDPGRTLLFMRDDRIQVRFTADELSKERDAGTFHDWREEPVQADGARNPPVRNTFALANDNERARCARAVDYLMSIEALPAPPRGRPGLSAAIATVHEKRVAQAALEGCFEAAPPGVSTFLRWRARWRKAGRTGDVLVPQNKMKGNRRAKLATDMSELLRELTDAMYLTRDGLSIAGLHQELERAIVDEDKILKPHQRRRAPSYEAVRKSVRGLCQYTVAYCREGKAVADERFRSVGPGIPTERANQVWEIDDTRLDLICVGTDGKVIGRPWLIVAIDRHTRMIVGFTITFHAPDTAAVMQVLKQSMLRKEALLEQSQVSGEWLAHGRPEELHVDNAKHYNSALLKDALGRMGIALHTMPVLKAWYKGTIERAIGTMTRQVFHCVAGTTHSNIFERDRETPPELVAETTIQDARRKLLDWVVNRYQHRHHRGIGAAPLTLWRQSVAGGDMRLNLDRSDIEMNLSIMVARLPRKEGLVFEQLVYTSEHVQEVRMLPKDQLPAEVRVLVNPADLTSINFLHPISGKLLPAFLRRDLRPGVENRTLEEYRLGRVILRNRGDEFEDDTDSRHLNKAVDASLADKAASYRQLHKVQAEGARERILAQGRRLRDGPADEQAVPGGDLDSLVQQAVAGHPADQEEPSLEPAEAAVPAHPAADGGDELDQWQAANLSKATTNKEVEG